jgi:hypothetical protein
MIDPDVDAIRKISTSPKDILVRVLQYRRRQDPRTEMEFHSIFKPNVQMQSREKIGKMTADVSQ